MARIASHATKLAQGHQNSKSFVFDGTTPPFLLGKKCIWKECNVLRFNINVLSPIGLFKNIYLFLV